MQNPRQNLEEEIKPLKDKVASLKKYQVTRTQHVIPIRRQILPTPSSNFTYFTRKDNSAQ